MIPFQCSKCGKSWQAQDSNAGKTARCACGALITVPAALAAGIRPVSAHGSQCPGCGEPILPNWRACPACGAQLSAKVSVPAAVPRDPALRPTEIHAGDNSVVNAEIHKPVTVNARPSGVALPQGTQGPMISVGNDAVVKATIDASQTMSAAGDIVGHKEVHTTHQETHFHQQESAAGAVMKNLWQLLNTGQDQEDKINRDFCEASNSDESLLALVTKQIAAIEAISFVERWAERRRTSARYSASMHALELVEQRNRNRPDVLAVVNRKREKLSSLVSSQRRPLFILFGGLGATFLLAIICSGILFSHEYTVREDVQTLIRQGKFDEARIRAQDISGSDNVKRMTEAIDKAENSRKPPSRSANESP